MLAPSLPRRKHTASNTSLRPNFSPAVVGRFFWAILLAVGLGGFTPAVAGADAATDTMPRFVVWLKGYIPTAHPDAKIIDHGGWVQGRMPGLVASWAEWNEKGITLKEVHDIEEGESVFIAKETRESWPESDSVVYFDGVGYFISGYSSQTMADWKVENATVVQFDGDAAIFSQAMAAARRKDTSFTNWLFRYIPRQYPRARMIDHKHWLQGYITDDLVASWAEWKDADSTLKSMERHGLKPGESMFIEQKGPRMPWADHPAVTHYEGGGYYISGYDQETMGHWDGKGLGVIQLNGDAASLAATIGRAWAQANPARSERLQVEFGAWLKNYIPAKYPQARIVDHWGWSQAHLPDGVVVNWAQWNESGITLKEIEAHALKDGKKLFISKPRAERWPESAVVVHHAGAGYYIDGYASATMSGWDVTNSTVIQFDGDARVFTKTMARDWAQR